MPSATKLLISCCIPYQPSPTSLWMPPRSYANPGSLLDSQNTYRLTYGERHSHHRNLQVPIGAVCHTSSNHNLDYQVLLYLLLDHSSFTTGLDTMSTSWRTSFKRGVSRRCWSRRWWQRVWKWEAKETRRRANTSFDNQALLCTHVLSRLIPVCC